MAFILTTQTIARILNQFQQKLFTNRSNINLKKKIHRKTSENSVVFIFCFAARI